jgi:hypothetical protein
LYSAEDQESPITYVTEVCHDHQTPNFEQRSNAGEVIMNDYQNIKVKEVTPIGSVLIARDYYNDGTSITTEVVAQCTATDLVGFETVGYSEYASSLEYNLDNLAAGTLQQAYANINKSEMNLLVTIAEIKKSVKTLTRAFGCAVSLFQKLRRAEKLFQRGSVTAQGFISLWLEVRYGLRPLYYDARNAISALKSLSDMPRTRYTATDDYSWSSELDSWSYRTALLGGYGGKKYASITAGISAGVLVRHEVNVNNVIRAFGLDDFAEAAWELLPFSFILDWFINVGTVIAAWEPEVGVKVLGSWLTVDETKTYGYSIDHITHTVSLYSVAGNSHAGLTALRSERTVTRYANPDLSLIPSLNVRLDVSKLVDLLAIGAQILSSRWKFMYDVLNRYKF